MVETTRTVRLVAHSNGRAVDPSDFAIVEQELPAPASGQALLRTIALCRSTPRCGSNSPA